MTENVYDEGIVDLANAIVAQAVKDYLIADDPRKHIDKAEIEAFFESSWYELLTSVCSDYILERIGK